MTTNNLTASELRGAVWRKSSYSGGSEGQCVEVADLSGTAHVGMRAVRDSKAPDGPVLLFAESTVVGFLGDLRNGKFSV
ncbi:DUF397 domain-containing protein [Streptomyces sp. NPDC002526]